MKKILWFVVLMILSPKFILASEIIYSDYSEFGPYSEEYISSNELIDVRTEKRYLWYKTEKILGNYELYTGNSNVEDCYDTDYSSWSNIKEEKLGRTYEERIVYNYELSKPLRYIHLTNLYGSYGAFRIPELIVKVNGIEIDYNYTCEGCMSGFDEYIHNGIYNENKSYISNGGSLIIDLKQEYPAQNVEIIFYIFDLGNEDKKYTIGYSNDKKNIYATKDFIYEFSDEYWVNSKLVNHYIYDLGIDESLWTTKAVYYNPIQSEYILDEYSYKEYRYKETYCKIYIISKIYSSIYTKYSYENFNIKDESKVKTYYSYRTRDKLELQDNLIINSYNYDLDDFVIYSSSEYETIDNIDINKNGIYNIIFKTSNMEIEKLVEVNIIDNTISTYQEEINSLYKTIEELNNKIKGLENKYQKDIEEKNNTINSIKEQLKLCYENCEENINCLENEIQNKDSIINQYQLENNVLKQEIEDLKNKINDLQEENKETILQLNNCINSLEENIKIKDEELNLLIEENKILKQNIINLKKENDNYTFKIEELEKLNNQYIEKLSLLEDKINELNYEIELLKNKNNYNDEELKKLNELINIYTSEINTLNEQIISINLYINELKEKSETELENMKNEFNEIYETNKEYYENIVLLENKIKDLNETIITLRNQSEQLNNDLNNKINTLEILNTEYLNKISELEIQLHNLNKGISDTIKEKNEIIEIYKKEIELKEKENELKYETLNNTIEEKTIENDSLNEKLNNYMLKINGVEKFNLFWIYLLAIFLLLIYILLRKKSTKK